MMAMGILGVVLWISEPAEIVRLLIGGEVVVHLQRETFDEARGIEGTRVDNGALIDLRWDQMHRQDAERIRRSFGYLPDGDQLDPVMVEATKVVMTNGVEFLGILEEQAGTAVVLRQKTKTWQLPLAQVRRREEVWVDALDVYEGEEVYLEELAQGEPSSPLEHYNLALFCERLQLWPRVGEHLARCRELDSDFKSDDVSRKLLRAERLEAAGEDAEELGRVKRLARRNQFPQSLAAIEAFLEARGDSPLAAEFAVARDRIVKQRGEWLTGKVVANLFAHMERFAWRVAGDAELSLSAARKRMTAEATDYAIQAVATQTESTPEEVRSIWEDDQRFRGAPRIASYGAGTFTLGEQDALRGLTGEELDAAVAQGSGNANDEENDLASRVRRIIEERKRQAESKEVEKKDQGFRIQDVPPNRDEWWARTGKRERSHYLIAFWAEREPSVELVSVLTTPCVRCAGTGVLEGYVVEQGVVRSPCSRCKALRVDRKVRFQ